MSNKPNTFSIYTIVTFCFAVVILTWATIIFAPSLRAAADGITQQFGLVFFSPKMTIIPTHPDSISEEFGPIPVTNLEEVQRQVPFRIPLPTWLPEGVTLRGARVLIEPAIWVQLSYVNKSPIYGSAGLGIEITQGSNQGNYLFPAREIEQVIVHKHSATYVRGAWHDDGNWDETADVGTLSWETDGFTYRIQSSGLNLTSEDLIRVAESMQ